MSLYTIDEFGRAVVDSRGLFELWFQGVDENGLSINSDPEVTLFNEQCAAHDKREYEISLEEDIPVPHQDRINQWNIPEEYLTIDIGDVCLSLCASDEARVRVRHEIRMFEERNMLPVLQTLLYMVTTLREKNVLWGVGRGSSVASYVLFLLGVHRINSMKYGLQVEDFLR